MRLETSQNQWFKQPTGVGILLEIRPVYAQIWKIA